MGLSVSSYSGAAWGGFADLPKNIEVKQVDFAKKRGKNSCERGAIPL
ncbi:MAG: hypothetical protein IJQ42_11235 [Oscillospiraceae bacterium]|nr:hypothetical protein [Oscillospiraceae bacterium]